MKMAMWHVRGGPSISHVVVFNEFVIFQVSKLEAMNPFLQTFSMSFKKQSLVVRVLL